MKIVDQRTATQRIRFSELPEGATFFLSPGGGLALRITTCVYGPPPAQIPISAVYLGSGAVLTITPDQLVYPASAEAIVKDKP